MRHAFFSLDRIADGDSNKWTPVGKMPPRIICESKSKQKQAKPTKILVG
jgi:hypothetical protein